MANTRSSSIGPECSRGERIAGFCYLPLGTVVLPWGLKALFDLLNPEFSPLQLNLSYFVLNFIIVWIIFRNFLLRSFRNLRFWELVQALILGFALHYAGTLLLNRLLALLPVEIPAYNNDAVSSLILQNRPAMLVSTLLLVPVAEETLMRGLVFGTLRPKSRVAAYVLSVAVFSLLHVWKYFFTADPGSVLLAAIPYIPSSIALAWTYEKSNTVWGPILLHSLINAMAFGLIPRQ